MHYLVFVATKMLSCMHPQTFWGQPHPHLLRPASHICWGHPHAYLGWPNAFSGQPLGFQGWYLQTRKFCSASRSALQLAASIVTPYFSIGFVFCDTLLENKIFTEAVPSALVMTFLMVLNLHTKSPQGNLILGDARSPPYMFSITFTTSVLSAGLGLAKCLKVGFSRTAVNDNEYHDDISC